MERSRKRTGAAAKAAAFLASVLLLTGAAGECPAGQAIVGRDVVIGDVMDFYYTVDASTAPPHYQRYRFFADDGRHVFYHETREGGGWPQTEKDITVSGTRQLGDAEWKEFFGLLEGGTVRDREEHLDDGDVGPWMFLYWKGDNSTCQEFSFARPDALFAFEDFCERLKNAPADR